MALDEWMLHNGPAEPVFWLWRNSPSVIIGYNQNAAAEVNLEYLREHGIKLARRVTGGGAVYHDLQNLNYSFAGPLGSVSGECGPGGGCSEDGRLGDLDSGASTDSQSIAPPIRFVEALRSLGLAAELSGRNDIFIEGRKISGYARSLWKNREIIHGTLMYDVDIDTLTAALNVVGSSKLALKGVASVRSRVTNVRDYLPQFSSLDEVQAALKERLSSPEFSELCLTKDQIAQIDSLAAEKFGSPSWIYRL